MTAPLDLDELERLHREAFDALMEGTPRLDGDFREAERRYRAKLQALGPSLVARIRELEKAQTSAVATAAIKGFFLRETIDPVQDLEAATKPPTPWTPERALRVLRELRDMPPVAGAWVCGTHDIDGPYHQRQPLTRRPYAEGVVLRIAKVGHWFGVVQVGIEIVRSEVDLGLSFNTPEEARAWCDEELVLRGVILLQEEVQP